MVSRKLVLLIADVKKTVQVYFTGSVFNDNSKTIVSFLIDRNQYSDNYDINNIKCYY